MNHDTLHILAIPIAGAVLITIGTVPLAIGLWRARTVPRWVLVAGVAASLVLLVLPPSSIAGVVVEAVSSLTTTLVGWYAWRFQSSSRYPAMTTIRSGQTLAIQDRAAS